MKRPWMLGVAVSCFLMAGCLFEHQEQMDQMIIALPKLTSAIQWIPHSGLQSQGAVLADVFTKKPEFKPIFADTQIKWRCDSSNNLDVLICSPDGKKALLEDDSRTPQVDRLWYQTDPTHPAEFSLILLEN